MYQLFEKETFKQLGKLLGLGPEEKNLVQPVIVCVVYVSNIVIMIEKVSYNPMSGH